MIKYDKGITLVSLVITVVVITILAGITVSYTIGDNGIISESERIKENTILSQEEGQEIINALKREEKYTEDGTVVLGDTDAPTINSIEINDKLISTNNNSLKINVNITETGVGIAKIEYSIDDGASYITPLDNQTKTYTFDNLKSGEEYKIKVRVTDKKGNEAIASKTVTTKGEKIENNIDNTI